MEVGLGLAISKHLAELMGGEIGLESTPDRGSKFWFTVRLDLRPGPAAETRPRRGGLRALRTLVVDDNTTNRTILQQQLRAWGMPCAGTANGPHALGLLREAVQRGQPYELAIIDMHMPGMGGAEVARAIGADPHLSGLPLVLLTSLTSTDQRELSELSRQAGVTACLPKPIRQSRLYDCLATVAGAANASGAARSEREVIEPQGETATSARARILLAEDNALSQKVTALMLEKLGHRVDLAGNGAQAVASVERIPYDAVLMDCHMPEMDGFEATAQIRLGEGGTHHIPIIAMTADAMEEDRERCLAAGMDDYISKPVKIAHLETVLRRWVERAGSDAAAAPAELGVTDRGAARN